MHVCVSAQQKSDSYVNYTSLGVTKRRPVGIQDVYLGSQKMCIANTSPLKSTNFNLNLKRDLGEVLKKSYPPSDLKHGQDNGCQGD